MAFLDSFEIAKKKSMYSVRYKDKVLCQVKKSVLEQIIIDHASAAFRKKLGVKKVEIKTTKNVESKALAYAKKYNAMKAKHYGNKNIIGISKSDDAFKHFVKAALIMEAVGCKKFEEFMEAQIEGLAFINNGQGAFPQVNHLSTTKAQDRYLSFFDKHKASESADKVKREYLTAFDRDTELTHNPKVKAYYKKIKKKTASLREALFVADCQVARNGSVTSVVRDYIEDITGESYEY